ncbi:alpha/beta hydrolase fold domain-containing protein [Rhizobium lusitanum]|uniref:alpha/beta hydrolase fold domain-containing protein n=1 Tax=Rhizobium lusitanum TaxID=293958 RepID=UPI00195B1D0C|nr:alpha/beta hydrolase [Rhizobium lusitanum]MBM7046312.1 alpha/beta hydrolase [Rhizobium lusitanum]
MNPSQAPALPLRFQTPRTVSPQAAVTLAALYEASRQTPEPTTPLSQADFDDANRQMEAAFAPPNAQLADALGVTIRRETIARLPVVRITPRDHRPGRRGLAYVHGGAYVYFSAGTLLGLPALIATATSLEVISIDYTLAPRARWEAVTDQVLAVWEALLAGGYDPAALGLLGDSAGGGLAAGSVLKMRDRRLALPGALWLVSPWSDISGAGDTYETLKSADPILAPESLAWCVQAYADPADHRHPYVSPVYGDYGAAFPPTLIQGGTREIFLSNFVRHYQAIRMGGHDAVLDLYEGMPHVFQSVVPDALESRTAIARAAAFFDAHLVR